MEQLNIKISLFVIRGKRGRRTTQEYLKSARAILKWIQRIKTLKLQTRKQFVVILHFTTLNRMEWHACIVWIILVNACKHCINMGLTIICGSIIIIKRFPCVRGRLLWLFAWTIMHNSKCLSDVRSSVIVCVCVCVSI